MGNKYQYSGPTARLEVDLGRIFLHDLTLAGKLLEAKKTARRLLPDGGFLETKVCECTQKTVCYLYSNLQSALRPSIHGRNAACMTKISCELAAVANPGYPNGNRATLPVAARSARRFAPGPVRPIDPPTPRLPPRRRLPQKRSVLNREYTHPR
jgi:hypothetical protein